MQDAAESNSLTLLPDEYEESVFEQNGLKVIPFDKIIFSKIKDTDMKARVQQNLEIQQIENPKTFFGYRISNLYDFFMLFVFMAGAASIILFFLSKTLLRMMHGLK